MSESGMSESGTRDGAAVRFPPPLVPLIALVVGLVIQRFVWPLPFPDLGLGRTVAGGLLLAGGVGLIMAAGRLFQQSGQDPKPWESTPEIIARGIYRRTRNPMYLGMGLLQAGLGVLLSNLWIIALVPVSWGVIHRIAIRHEEAYLERKFGSSYTDYKASVRRWL